MLGLFALISLWFVDHAWRLGWQGLTQDLSAHSRLYWPDAPVATTAIFLHMLGGAIITLLAPLQLIGPVRRRLPWLHRLSGRVLVGAAVVTALGGLVYIGSRGTIGGWDMSLSFGLYGLLMLTAAVQTIRFARARRFDRHQRWAWRLAVLAVGSWLYRLHYAVWEMATGGAGTAEDFSGAFDLVNIWAFYLPYLILLELILARRASRATS